MLSLNFLKSINKNLTLKYFPLINGIPKFTFARKNNNKSGSPQNLFSKFQIPEEVNSENKNKEHFTKVFRKNYPNENLNIEDKNMDRLIEDKVFQGKSVKETVRDILEEEGPDNSIGLNDRFEGIGDSLQFKNIKDLYKDEMDLIKRVKNKEDRRETDIDASPFEQKLYNENDMKVLDLLRSKKNIEEKDVEFLNKYKVKKSKNIDSEDAASRTAGSFLEKEKKKKNDPEHEEMTKEFHKTFNKDKKKKKDKKEKKNEDQDLFESNIRNLRQIKNSTSPEYSNSITLNNNEQDNNNNPTDLVENIPDIDIVQKRSKNFEVEESFKDLMKMDVHPYDKMLERRDALIDDATKLSKMNVLNIVNVRRNRNEIFKLKALDLATVWNMDALETKHWYYRLRREEKVIFKAILMRKKLEQKRKLKKIAKHWKIENEENIDINYLQLLREENGQTNKLEPEKLDVPKEYKNVNEYIFFGDDTDFFRHYKRTCKNIMNSLNQFFETDKQSIRKGIGKNVKISVSEVKMNKACTVVYIWWDLPLLDSPLLDVSENDQKAIFNNVELNINQSAPYIKGVLTRDIGLKYAPDLRFIRDSLDEEMNTFEKEIKDVKDEDRVIKLSKKRNTEEKILRLLNTPDILNNLKIMISKINNMQLKQNLSQTFLGDGSDNNNNSISSRIRLLEKSNPELYSAILIYVKNTTGINETNIEEIYKKYENTTEGKKISKLEQRTLRRKEKALQKINLKPSDLEVNKQVDIQNSVNNFLQQYERKIPGQYSLNPSMSELKERKNKKDYVDEIIGKKIKSDVRKVVQKSEKIGRTNYSRRVKSAEFWRGLDKM